MEAVTKFFGQDAESKLKAAQTLVEQKRKELADAETALSALQATPSGTISSDGVTGGRKRKTRKTKRSRTGRKSNRS